jgi:hypothetical protein
MLFFRRRSEAISLPHDLSITGICGAIFLSVTNQLSIAAEPYAVSAARYSGLRSKRSSVRSIIVFAAPTSITLIGGAAASWPVEVRAQQPERMRRIGVRMGWPESDPEAQSELASFVQELQKLGWAEGRNLRTDTRWWIPADPCGCGPVFRLAAAREGLDVKLKASTEGQHSIPQQDPLR